MRLFALEFHNDRSPWDERAPSWAIELREMLALVIINQETNMATLADIVAADAAVKTELDTITAGVTSLVASNKALADQLAAAVASNDPAALQAALDQANANVAEGNTVVGLLPAAAGP